MSTLNALTELERRREAVERREAELEAWRAALIAEDARLRARIAAAEHELQTLLQLEDEYEVDVSRLTDVEDIAPDCVEVLEIDPAL